MPRTVHRRWDAKRRAASILALIIGLGFSDSSAADPGQAAIARGKPFWRQLADGCVVPAGESAGALVHEAVALLGSRDPEWRDDIGYGVIVSCVYQRRLLSPAERRDLVATLSANLRKGIGETGTDSVLLRSFSALDLSILAALEVQDPVLDAPGYRGLLEDALAYLRDERDTRGFEEGIGWIHATAHTADLLKFLARDARFAPADQGRLLDAVWNRATQPGAPVWTHAEDERLAAAVVSVLRRSDRSATVLEPWLARFTALERQTWTMQPLTPAALDTAQNARNLLQAVFVLLSYSEPEPTPGQVAARAQVLATLQAIRR